MIIRIEIPLAPKAQKRDRITARGGFARSYKDKSQKLAEDKLLSLLIAHKPSQPLQGPISLNVSVYIPLPKSKPKVWRQKALAREIRPTVKPDIDNFAKQILDVMSTIYFDDDKQVVDMHLGKWYGDPPRWEIVFKGEY